MRSDTASTFVVNSGQSSFNSALATDYLALNTANMPAPTITKPSDHFKTIIYEGTGAELSTGDTGVEALDFQPDFVWIKRRNDGHHHALFDSVRGTQKSLCTSRVDLAEYNETTSLDKFLSNGISFNGGGYFFTNVNSAAFVAWCWRGGSPINYTSG